MFGEDYGSTLGKDTCERCGSEAQLRGLQRVNTAIIICHATCHKCHHVKFAGFTSVNELAYQGVKNRLEKLYDKAEHPKIKERIGKALRRLQANKELHDLGL